MTLKEKFENIEIMFEGQTGILKYDEMYEASNQCEQIADDYAIEFAEWISKLEFKEYSNGWGRIWYKDLYSTKELLEIFKKEKGL